MKLILQAEPEIIRILLMQVWITSQLLGPVLLWT
jgi:hypothetical protein